MAEVEHTSIQRLMALFTYSTRRADTDPIAPPGFVTDADLARLPFASVHELRAFEKLMGRARVPMEIWRIASVIARNAELAPDPRMGGEADCYLVPLDDIEALRELFSEAGA